MAEQNLEGRRDIGIVWGIEGSDTAHAVIEVIFPGALTENIKFWASQLEGLGPLTIGSSVFADFRHDGDVHPTPVSIDYVTDEEEKHLSSY